MVAESAKCEKTAQHLASYPPRQPLPAIAHFAKPAGIPPRKRARNVQKPYQKPCEKPFKRRITVRITVWLARICRAFSTRLTQACSSLALSWRPSASGNVPAKTRRYGTAPRPHETLAQTPCAEKTRYAAPVGGLSGRITAWQRHGNRGVSQVWRMFGTRLAQRGGSVVYTTLLPAPFPAGPAGGWSRPRHREKAIFEFVPRRRTYPESRRVCRFRCRRDCDSGPNARSILFTARGERVHMEAHRVLAFVRWPARQEAGEFPQNRDVRTAVCLKCA
jgi:hypothetical protein